MVRAERPNKGGGLGIMRGLHEDREGNRWGGVLEHGCLHFIY